MASEFKQKFAGLAKIIKDGAPDVVAAAIRNELGIVESVWAFIDKDEPMGTPVFHLVTANELLKDQNFSIAFTDQIYENGVPQIEASRYLYDIHSGIGAYLRWRSLPSELPAAFDIQIQGIEKGFSRAKQKLYIARVGGVVDGKSWWLTRFKASDMIAKGERRFFVRAPDGSETTVVNVTPPGWQWPYLTTPGDGRPDNDLLRCQSCKMSRVFEQRYWNRSPELRFQVQRHGLLRAPLSMRPFHCARTSIPQSPMRGHLCVTRHHPAAPWHSRSRSPLLMERQ